MCKDKPEWALAAVLISSFASLFIGLTMGYLVQHCRMKKKMKIENVNDELLDGGAAETYQEENTYGRQRPTSINQDIKRRESTPSEHSTLDEHEIHPNNNKHELKY
jgi:hypothetical protein